MKQTIEIPEGFELKKVSDTEYQIVKKEVKFPNTWEEFCESHKIYNKNECFIESDSSINNFCSEIERRDSKLDRNVLPNEEYAAAILALCQLIQLRDCYRQGWKPDWNNGRSKFCISFLADGKPGQYVSAAVSCILSFQSAEIKDKFLDNFRDLIETAGYLWK